MFLYHPHLHARRPNLGTFHGREKIYLAVTVDRKLTGKAHSEQIGREDQTKDQAVAESSTRVDTLILTN
jgi:hypothetical protein